MKVDELVLACSDHPEESQLTAGIHGDYLYVLLEDDKSMPRDNNEDNFEFFIDEPTAQKMYDQLKTIKADYTISRRIYGDLEGSEFYISILEGSKNVLLVEYTSYAGITATYEDAIRFREYLWIFINREEIGVEL